MLGLFQLLDGHKFPRIEQVLGMSKIYGAPFCPLLKDSSLAPPGFCGIWDSTIDIYWKTIFGKRFNQFILENIMLTKWMNHTCPADRRSCLRQAAAVVVPSLDFHMRVAHNWSYSWDIVLTNRMDLQRQFWKRLFAAVDRPAENHAPHVIIHLSYVFDNAMTIDTLASLSELEPHFVKRVIIATLESNVRTMHSQYFFHPEWRDGTEPELQRRERECGSLDKRMGLGPLLITVPYSIPVERAVAFATSSGSYSASRPRRIAISWQGSMKRSELGATDGGNWIRERVYQHVAANGERSGLVCAEQGAAKEKDCGLPGDQWGYWDVVVNSVFCLEPAGDTLTRSHVYIAILGGCIPVLFDGGHSLYPESVVTWWPWRGARKDSKPRAPFLDYSEFSVLFNASDVKAGAVHVVKELLRLSQDRKRLRKLREGVDRVAPMMRYAIWDDAPDAFTQFRCVVNHSISKLRQC